MNARSRCWGRVWRNAHLRRCRHQADWPLFCRSHVSQAIVVIAALFATLIGFASSPLYKPVAHVFNGFIGVWNTPEARGNRLSVYITRFGDDEPSDRARDRVIASIRSELGDRVEVTAANFQLDGTQEVTDDSALAKATRQARAFLKDKHGDLLIWGKFYTLPETKPQIEIRFVSAGLEFSASEPFGLTDKLMLDGDFGPEMGAVLAAFANVGAAPVVHSAGRSVVTGLHPVATRLRPLIRNLPVSMRPEDRVTLLWSFALIETMIGEQSGELAPLEEALAALRRALLEPIRLDAPIARAKIQSQLGGVLRVVGARTASVAQLEEAVASYDAALKAQDRARTPFEWALTQNGLGDALSDLGRVTEDPGRIEEAVRAYQAALREHTRERVPEQWAADQSNLGGALVSLSNYDDSEGRLEEAITAFRAASQVETRERAPLYWALYQRNLGDALRRRGRLGGDPARLTEAVLILRTALLAVPRASVPLDWAATEENLGEAYLALGQWDSDPAHLREAVEALRAALEVNTHGRDARRWADLQVTLGNALLELGQRTGDPGIVRESAVAFRAALDEQVLPSSQTRVVQDRLGVAEKWLSKP